MAFDNDQKEFPLPSGSDSEKRNITEFLPKYFRTPANSKFFNSTLTQLVSPGTLEKLNAFYGRKDTASYQSTDLYVPEVSADRANYKFEPSVVQKDDLGNVNFYADYLDYVNQIRNFNGYTADPSLLNAQEYYAWSPKIDWDKFVNYREYFWMPYGASTVTINGQQRNVVSTYTVTKSDQGDNYAYLFTPDGLTVNPTLKLYKGQTYKFDISAEGLPFVIRTERVLDASYNFADGIDVQDVEKGVITFEVKDTAPEKLYYGASNDINAWGLIQIFDIDENSVIDVEKEVLGKKNYTTSTGTALSNGMKVDFKGTVTPISYAQGEYYVEGVGEAIQLINIQNLEVVSSFTESVAVPFDSQNFDTVGFGTATSYALYKDYVVINRSSPDRNPWARHNRWIHRSVIEASAVANGQVPNIDQSTRARRPIIEFEAGLKLFQYGSDSKGNVDLIDTTTQDVMSDVEGSIGYYVDGVELTNGMRVLFTADLDPTVNNKIFEVKFIDFNDGSKTTRQISLIDIDNGTSLLDETVLVTNGIKNQGKIFYFNGTTWKPAQEKTAVNQSPMFDLFDNNGTSYADSTMYPNSSFRGNKLFSYAVGTGANDPELGFPLKYLNVENIGDIQFDFDLVNGSYVYQTNNVSIPFYSKTAYLKKYKDRTNSSIVNGWLKANTESYQNVVRQYVATEDLLNEYPIDVYDASGDLNDLQVKVYVNNQIKNLDSDYAILRVDQIAYVRFVNDLKTDDIVIIKTRSATEKNSNGHYEFPTNLQANPLNAEISTFTLGQVTDHVKSITDELPGIQGQTPGVSNLRDFPNASTYGRKFLQHSGSIALSTYLVCRKDINILKAIEKSQKDYSKFKRAFINATEDLGFDGTSSQMVDKILEKINKDNTKKSSYFQSDMIGTGGVTTTTHTVYDTNSQFFPISSDFNLDQLSNQAIYVYYQDQQLIHGLDYVFSNQFVQVIKTLQLDDEIVIKEYDTTNGNHVPQTPTKLGLYPKFTPKKYLDTTLVNPVNVIQGHDGSITVAYDDFRDDLILELEKRIYNNIKITFDVSLFDYTNFLPNAYRTNQFKSESINKTLIVDFNEWLPFVGGDDYTANNYFSLENSLTWNYSSMTSPQGETLDGFWRAIYKKAFNTDRPNIAPWEMLGYTEEPTWWQTVYGSAPYTKDNLILWQDLEKGIVREPGKKIIVVEKYKRPGLTNSIPVDSDGNIRSPWESNFANGSATQNTDGKFKFGDCAPIENAWRRSSDYPFAILKSFLLHQPNKIIGTGWDTSRITRNSAGQIVYSTGLRLQPKDLIFPNSSSSDSVVFTSGLVNYLYEYIDNDILTDYDLFQKECKSIKVQIGFKLRGFSDKNNFKLVLDSKTPTQSSTVFVPEENYELFYNNSTAISIATYSGLIIEKLSSGYSIKGYDKNDPNIRYKQHQESANDSVINVGGVSASFINWTENKRYDSGAYVKYQNNFYAVDTTHISDSTFDNSKFIRLATLPVEGGARAFIRKRFDNETITIPYGTVFATTQEVVDVIMGYEKYLNEQGFEFNNFNKELQLVANWQLSAKEFLFWTTQNWKEGSVIALSPASNRLTLKSEYSTADNVVENFYAYGILKEDGFKLDKNFMRIIRDDNLFELTTKNTINGIYFVKIPLIQKEHVCLIDNITAFNDLIYDPASGYKQDRIKVLGYITEWTGGQSIPGFIHAEAKITEWQPYTDYAMSDVVKYKEFYYTANSKLKGTQKFENENWKRLDDKPTNKLLANFEYRTNQFADFYDLDTDNFDSEQQRLAQHLIGYQPREYLRNIINDEVSQYKFYQGFIADKGTANSLNKLFDALASADKESIEFHEEWAIRKGQYGAVDTFDEIEYKLDEQKIRLNPQPIELTDNISNTDIDLVYRIQSGQTYLAPDSYDHKPFPTKYVEKTYVGTAGPVHPIDISLTLANYSDLLTSSDVATLSNGQYVWVGNYINSWNVFKFIDTEQTVVSIIKNASTITVNTTNTAVMTAGEIFVVKTDSDNFVFKCVSANGTAIVCENKEGFTTKDPVEGTIKRFITSRLSSINDINTVINDQNLKDNEKFWVDVTDDGRWKIVNNKFVFKTHNEISSTSTTGDESFGRVIAVNKQNTTLLVSQPDDGDGKIYVFTRGSESGALRLNQIIQAPTSDPLLTNVDLFGPNSSFGQGLDISPDGNFILIGAPTASNLKTEYKGIFDPLANYNVQNIVQYKQQLWRATNQIVGENNSVDFSTFDASGIYAENIGSSTTNILIGDSVFPNEVTNHLLIRASADQYNGTKIGDKLVLKYLDFSTSYPIDRNNYNKTANQPFNGVGAPTIKNNVFDGSEITIDDKVDEILEIELTITDPLLQGKVSTDTAEGIIVYIRKVASKTLLYLKNVKGIFSTSGTLVYNTLTVGEYVRVNTEDYNYLGGWFKVSTGTPVPTTAGQDTTKNLVIQDIKLSTENRDSNLFFNAMEEPIVPITPQTPLVKSQFGIATYYQEYFINPSTNGWESNPSPVGITSNKWFVRTSYDFAHDSGFNTSNSANEISVWFNNVDQNAYDFSNVSIDQTDTNGLKEVVDVWEGYVDVDSQPDNNVNYYFPEAGVHKIYDPITRVEADVTYVQFIGLEKIRIYFNNRRNTSVPSGSKLFSLGSNAGQISTIVRIGSGVDRLIGSIEQTVQSGPTDGDILVFAHTESITASGNPSFVLVNDLEYWMWDEQVVDGITLSANVPNSTNRDWLQVYNIPVGEGVQSSFTNQGAFLVYKKGTNGQFTYQSAFTVPDTQTDLRLGTKIKIRDVAGTIVAFVGASGNETTSLPGKIYFVEYNQDKNWWLSIDPLYMGEFDVNNDYSKNELVVYNNQLFKALTNMSAGMWNNALWQLQDSHTDFLGYVPNDSGIELEGDSTIDQNGLIKFADRFDIDSNGVNLIVNAVYNNDQQKVVVYRLDSGHYTYKQTLTPPDDSAPTINFGADISISGDGELIAVGSPLKDISNIDMGAVYVYKKSQDDVGQYSLNQTLTSPSKETSELFGNSLSFSGAVLAVTSLNGDQQITTITDDGSTVVNELIDSGSVHIFEKLENTLLYAEKFAYDNDSLQQFGSNLLVNNNHVYIGLPTLTLPTKSKGTVVDFRKAPDENSWNSIHESVDGVDQPDLSKIQGIMLYNRKTNSLLTRLDYVDPILGKIPGPAEAEIYYKTAYDPAVYNNENAVGVIDPTNSWSGKQVGRLWWNISKAKYYYPYLGNIIYNNSYWNKLFVGASIDVHEWVESKYTPTQWNSLSTSPKGEPLGISGTVDNTNDFVLMRKYDAVSSSFTNVYYYWVKNKKSIPAVESRTMSALSVSNLIKDPRSQGYKYVTLFSNNKFALVNCNQYIQDQDVVISFRIKNTDTKNNIHKEYALLTEGLATSKLPSDIETVWFNSLIGYDNNYNPVPDPALSEKLRYGTLTNPRQSWFSNRQEALKQTIERANTVLKNNLIVDEVDLSNLTQSEPAPVINTGLFDTVVDTEADLAFIGVGEVKTATLSLTIEEGKIIDVLVTDPGKGYRSTPTYKIKSTTGSGAELGLTIDSNGSVNSARVLSSGKNYLDNTSIAVRPFSALVSIDNTVDGKWAIYSYTSTDGWLKSKIQSYNVDLYWDYADWYADGYNVFTAVDQLIEQSYQIGALENSIGDIVKIKNIGTGGWLLLEKIDDQADVDYTINYKTVGRQNGTIQFSNKLYDVSTQNIGFDSNSFDVQLYDRQPIQETRVILETIRDKIFVEELAVEYNNLYFAGIRYALSENKLNDFVFKTSFVKAQHNVGELQQKISFKNDNVQNYEDYVKEIKPYKSKIREYVSSYQKTEPTNSMTTDFDLPPKYINGVIVPQSVVVENGNLVGSDKITAYPDKHWRDNVGYKIVSINIANPGTEYKNAPSIVISGGGGSGATATAYIKNGSVNRIVVTNMGSGYISAPTVTLSGSTTGVQATASAVLGESVVKTTHIGVKFDRTSGVTQITNLSRTETFTGNNSQLKFKLKWPMDLRSNTISIIVNDVKKLRSEYIYDNEIDNSKSYQRQTGYVQFTVPPLNLAVITITYKIDQDVLQTADRFELYSPTSGMPGKELAQVIDGIDYGGVEVRSIGFEQTPGWDNQPYMQGEWDTYDESYEDEVFYLDGSTLTLDLSKTLEAGVEYHVYQNGIRVDGPQGVMASIQGDGSTKTVDISMLETDDGDVIIVRKSTSDGSFLPDPDVVDTLIKGGDLAYSTAQGINAEDINIDGDGFVTEISAKGPEEFVPGQVLDTLDIQVYDRGANTGSKINSYNYVGDGVTKEFSFVDYPQSKEAVFLSVNNILIDYSNYNVDYQNKKIIFNQAPALASKINFITMGNNGESILDTDVFTGDGSTTEFVTRAPYQINSIQTFVRVNGEKADYTVYETDSGYAVNNKVAVRFNTAPAQDSVINIVVYSSQNQSFSEVTQNVYTADGSTSTYQLTPTPFTQTPFTNNVIVKVDNTVLRSGFHEKFTVSALREYEFRNYQVLPGTINSTDVRAYLNDVELTSAQYRWNPGNSSVTLSGGIGVAGDKLDVYIDNGEYSVTDSGQLQINVATAQGQTITAYQFSKHDIADIERNQYDVIAKLTVTVGTDDYYQYNQLTNGVVRLNAPAVDAQYVWVCVNGEWLAPSVDYTVSNDQLYLKINRTLSQNDQIDVIHFTAPSFVGKFAYRQFKDMMNRTHYKRIGNDRQYFLAQSLHWYDKEIVLTDATGITEPSVSAQLPGIIFIDGERIEYYKIDGNSLQQLRRGTFGTGIAEVHHSNTEVFDQSAFQSVPYKDQFISETYTGTDVVNNVLNIGFTPANVNTFELFVGGKRLRKNSISVYDPDLGQDSPEADETVPAEFTVDGTTARITFAEQPAENAKIVLVRKQGRTWQSGSDPLSQTENDIARFIRQKEVAVPQ